MSPEKKHLRLLKWQILYHLLLMSTLVIMIFRRITFPGLIQIESWRDAYVADDLKTTIKITLCNCYNRIQTY